MTTMTIEYDETDLALSKIVEQLRVAGAKVLHASSNEENEKKEELVHHLTQAVSETQDIVSGKTEGIGLETLFAEI